MKINYSNILLVAWSIIALLLYLSFFSSFGYLEIREKTLYKNNLIYENEYLEKENKLLEEKILKYDKNNLLKEDSYNIILFKFESINPHKYKYLENNNKINANFYDTKQLYFYLYLFIVIIGYIYIIFFKFKRDNTNI